MRLQIDPFCAGQKQDMYVAGIHFHMGRIERLDMTLVGHSH